MNYVLSYLLQVIVISALLFGYYHISLRNNRFHQYNRFYLLAATVLSITIPFLNIPVYFSQDDNSYAFLLDRLKFNASDAVVTGDTDQLKVIDHAPLLSLAQVLYIIYFFLAFIILLRVIISIARIVRLGKQNPVQQFDDIYFISTTEPGTPFSFFRWLFWNNDIELQSSKGEQVFRHELFHIRQRHSIDTVFMEIVTVIFWINPFFHLIKRELKAIHEFLADNHAIREETKWEYAELLLMQVLQTKHSIVNPFFHNQIKRRIAMITSSKKPGHQYTRKVMVLPLLALVAALFAFTYKAKQQESLLLTEDEIPLIEMREFPTTDTPPVKKPVNYYVSGQKIVVKDATNGKQTTFDPDLIIFNDQRYSKADFEEKINGYSIEGTVVITQPGDAEAIRKYGAKANKGVMEFKDAKMTKQSNVNLPIREETEPLTLFAKPHSHNAPLYVVDGVLLEDTGAIRKLNPNDIHSIQIYKNKIAIEKYGDRGKNGVIYILTKANKDAVIEEKKFEEITVTGYASKYPGKVIDGHPIAPDGEVKEVTVVGFPSKKAAGSQVKEVVVQGRPVNDEVREVTVVGYATKKDGNAQLKEVVAQGKPVNGEVVEVREVPVEQVVVGVQTMSDPKFPGGTEAWNQYLSSNLDRNIPASKNAPNGTYTVFVEFTVLASGQVKNVKALTNHGYGMEDEAVRVIKNGPAWKPAKNSEGLIDAVKRVKIEFAVPPPSSKLPTEAQWKKAAGQSKITQLPEVVFVSYTPSNSKFSSNRSVDKISVQDGLEPGSSAWTKFLERNLNGSVSLNDWKPGVYSVPVLFAVDKYGKVSAVEAFKNKGTTTADYCISFMRKMKATITSGEDKQYYLQPLTFVIESDKHTSNM